MSKLDQLRALREARLASRDREPVPAVKLSKPAQKIAAGLNEALAVAKGEAEPSKLHKFDRNAYQREYMRKWRKRKPMT